MLPTLREQNLRFPDKVSLHNLTVPSCITSFLRLCFPFLFVNLTHKYWGKCIGKQIISIQYSFQFFSFNILPWCILWVFCLLFLPQFWEFLNKQNSAFNIYPEVKAGPWCRQPWMYFQHALTSKPVLSNIVVISHVWLVWTKMSYKCRIHTGFWRLGRKQRM